MFRSVVAVGTGLAIGVTIIGIIESIGHFMFPPPAGVDLSDRQAVAAMIAQAPPGALIMVLVAWWLGTSNGAGIGAYLARHDRWLHGSVVAGVLMIAGIVNLFLIPHPTWFVLAALIVFPLSAVVGMLIGTQPVPGKRDGYIVENPPDYSQDPMPMGKVAGSTTR